METKASIARARSPGRVPVSRRTGAADGAARGAAAAVAAGRVALVPLGRLANFKPSAIRFQAKGMKPFSLNKARLEPRYWKPF